MKFVVIDMWRRDSVERMCRATAEIWVRWETGWEQVGSLMERFVLLASSAKLQVALQGNVPLHASRRFLACTCTPKRYRQAGCSRV